MPLKTVRKLLTKILEKNIIVNGNLYFLPIHMCDLLSE